MYDDKTMAAYETIIKDKQIISWNGKLSYCFNAHYYSRYATVGNDAMIKHYGSNDTLD